MLYFLMPGNNILFKFQMIQQHSIKKYIRKIMEYI